MQNGVGYCVIQKKVVTLQRKMYVTMRKSLVILAIALVFAGCQRSGRITSTIAHSNPIMPIRMTSDTMHVVMTDYVPVLYGDTSLWNGKLMISTGS